MGARLFRPKTGFFKSPRGQCRRSQSSVLQAKRARARLFLVACGCPMPHNKKPHPAKNRRAAGEKESNESDSNFPYLRQAILGHFRAHLHLETPRNGQATQRIDYESQISEKTSQNSAKTPISAGLFSALSPGGIEASGRSG